jgi:hypothetical protein
VVLLTATPHSGDVARFARLESIGALERIDDPLIIFRRTRAELALSTTRAVRWSRVSLSNAEHEVLDTLAAFEVRALNVAAAHQREDAALLLLSVFRKRALSTMAALDVTRSPSARRQTGIIRTRDLVTTMLRFRQR